MAKSSKVKYKPKVSIVTSCYNQSQFIESMIRSVVRQTWPRWELIIVDDASSDNSLVTIGQCKEKFRIPDDKIKVFKHEKNMGCGKSLRDAIEMSTGQLIAVVDGDDALAVDHALMIMIKAHKKHPEASLIYSDYWVCDRKLNKLYVYNTRQLRENETYLGTKIRISHLKVFKREFYDKTPGVNLELRQTVDKDLVLKLEEVGKLVHISEPLYLYRQPSTSLTNSFRRRDKTYRRFVLKMRLKVYDEARVRRGKLPKYEKRIKELEK